MTTDREVLLIRAQIEALVTEREGMIAENMQREHCGEAMAYIEANFSDVANQLRALASSPPEPQPVAENCVAVPCKAVTEEELKALMYQELKAAEPFGTAYAANVCARVAMRVMGGK